MFKNKSILSCGSKILKEGFIGNISVKVPGYFEFGSVVLEMCKGVIQFLALAGHSFCAAELFVLFW